MSGPAGIGAISPNRYFVTLSVVLGLLFGLVSPDNDEVHLAFRNILQWQLQTLIPIALLIVIQMLLGRWHRFDAMNPWLKLVLSGLLAALLFTPLALFIDVWLRGEALVNNSWWLSLRSEFFGIAPLLVLCWVLMNVPWLMDFQLQKPTPGTRQSEPEAPMFWRLVPASVQGDLLYLKAELHYMNVVTSKGKALVLYNLADAVEELGCGIGLQSHRSYWVSFAAVDSLVRSGRQGTLFLHNGDKIPVSRRNLALVSEQWQQFQAAGGPRA